jgi:hypothetical protein
LIVGTIACVLVSMPTHVVVGDTLRLTIARVESSPR